MKNIKFFLPTNTIFKSTKKGQALIESLVVLTVLILIFALVLLFGNYGSRTQLLHSETRTIAFDRWDAPCVLQFTPPLPPVNIPLSWSTILWCISPPKILVPSSNFYYDIKELSPDRTLILSPNGLIGEHSTAGMAEGLYNAMRISMLPRLGRIYKMGPRGTRIVNGMMQQTGRIFPLELKSNVNYVVESDGWGGQWGPMALTFMMLSGADLAFLKKEDITKTILFRLSLPDYFEEYGDVRNWLCIDVWKIVEEEIINVATNPIQEHLGKIPVVGDWLADHVSGLIENILKGLLDKLNPFKLLPENVP